ncbi:MAG: glycerate kinase [Candidatus Methanosuratincola sp.]|jgi:glycerate-2-kinase
MFAKSRENAITLFKEALSAADPRRCVLGSIRLDGEKLIVSDREYNLSSYRRIFVVAFGKASQAMAMALEDVLGGWITGGIVVSNSPRSEPFRKLRYIQSSHPVPDQRSVISASEIVSLLEGTDERDLVIFLISGGGSALLCLPAPGLTLEDKRKVTDILLVSGVETHALNSVRKHLSSIKGGGLLRKALPSQVITLILSDVVGDRLDAIASGPTVPDSSTFEDAWRVIEEFRLEHKLPPQVIVHIERGRAGEIPETLKVGEFDAERVQTVLVGSNYLALKAAQRKAEALGYNTLLLSSQIKGEAREVAKAIAGIAFDVERFDMPVSKPACIVFGGETTVTVKGKGIGGRSMEAALSFCIEIMGHGILGLFCGTDGIDGPTDAAGAVCDGTTRLKGREINLSARESLMQNDSYTFFDKLGCLIKTGPTGTNVMDIGIVIVE